MKLGLFNSEELSNKEYHAKGNFYSSSQFKKAKEDIELFHKIYITGEIVEDTDKPAFHIGTHFHSSILEPEKLHEDCAVFRGKVRRGKEWDAFKAVNGDKAIITAKEEMQVKNLLMAFNKCSTALKIMENGLPEVSVGVELHGLKVKARADWIDYDNGFIMDLKSTTGNAKDVEKVIAKIDAYDYDLSAALYIDAFNEYLGKKGLPLLETFKWVFASKDFVNCQVYNSTPEMLEVGRAKYMKALKDIVKYKENGWVFIDEEIDIKPMPWTRQRWLEDSGPVKVEMQPERIKMFPVTDQDLL